MSKILAMFAKQQDKLMSAMAKMQSSRAPSRPRAPKGKGLETALFTKRPGMKVRTFGSNF